MFNHNLWFCAACSLIAHKFPDVNDHTSLFINNIPHNLLTYFDNTIHHSSPFYLSSFFQNPFLISARLLKNRIFANRLYLKSVGYHSFNLYALSLIYSRANLIWNQQLQFIPKLFLATRTASYRKNIVSNKYSFEYNAPGFELPFVQATLFPHSTFRDLEYWFFTQLAHTLQCSSSSELYSTFDTATLNARIYQLSRILPLL